MEFLKCDYKLQPSLSIWILDILMYYWNEGGPFTLFVLDASFGLHLKVFCVGQYI